MSDTSISIVSETLDVAAAKRTAERIIEFLVKGKIIQKNLLIVFWIELMDMYLQIMLNKTIFNTVVTFLTQPFIKIYILLKSKL